MNLMPYKSIRGLHNKPAVLRSHNATVLPLQLIPNNIHLGATNYPAQSYLSLKDEILYATKFLKVINEPVY